MKLKRLPAKTCHELHRIDAILKRAQPAEIQSRSVGCTVSETHRRRYINNLRAELAKKLSRAQALDT